MTLRNHSQPTLAGAVTWLLSSMLSSLPVQAQTADDGRALATSGASGVVACATCHGAQGEGQAAAGFPYLAGQSAAYLQSQLGHFASGSRENPVMEPIAQALDAEQMAAVATYYSELPRVIDVTVLSATVETYPKKDALGAWIANRGDWDNNIPACIQCHGPGGVGVGVNFPALAGLPAIYLSQQLNAWKEQKRPDGPLGLMGEIARRMNDEQIDAVANYFAELPSHAKMQQNAKE